MLTWIVGGSGSEAMTTHFAENCWLAFLVFVLIHSDRNISRIRLPVSRTRRADDFGIDFNPSSTWGGRKATIGGIQTRFDWFMALPFFPATSSLSLRVRATHLIKTLLENLSCNVSDTQDNHHGPYQVSYIDHSLRLESVLLPTVLSSVAPDASTS